MLEKFLYVKTCYSFCENNGNQIKCFIVFTSEPITGLQGNLSGTLNDQLLLDSRIVAKTNVDGRLDWTVTTAEREEPQRYLPLLPALIVPAGWLTGQEASQEVQNGLKSSDNGAFTATLTLDFPTGEILEANITSLGVIPIDLSQQEYSVNIAGAHPDGFDASRLFPLSLDLRSPSAGVLRSSKALPGDIALSFMLVYTPSDPSVPVPPLDLQTDLAENPITDGRILTFATRATLTAEIIAVTTTVLFPSPITTSGPGSSTVLPPTPTGSPTPDNISPTSTATIASMPSPSQTLPVTTAVPTPTGNTPQHTGLPPSMW